MYYVVVEKKNHSNRIKYLSTITGLLPYIIVTSHSDF